MVNPRDGKGLIEETEKLKKTGLTWKRIYELGFEYKYPAMFLRGEINKEEMLEKIISANRKYAKKQMTWFSAKGGSASGGKHNKTKWIKNYTATEKLVKKFI